MINAKAGVTDDDVSEFFQEKGDDADNLDNQVYNPVNVAAAPESVTNISFQ